MKKRAAIRRSQDTEERGWEVGEMIDAAEGSISQLQGGEDRGKTKTFQGGRK